MVCGGSPLIDSTKRNVSRRNTTKALQKYFRRLEEISDQKGRKSLPSVGNFNCSVICVEYVDVLIFILGLGRVLYVPIVDRYLEYTLSGEALKCMTIVLPARPLLSSDSYGTSLKL